MMGFTDKEVGYIKAALSEANGLLETHATQGELDEISHTLAGLSYLITPDYPVDDEDKAIMSELYAMEKRIEQRLKGVIK